MLKGTVEWFADRLGYGFIRSDAGKGPILVHYTAIQMDGHKSLTAGETVYFELGQGRNGPRAVNVYRQEMYERRQAISDHGRPISLDALVRDPRFLQEIERAYYQLPFRTVPGREWFVAQLIGFEPARVAQGDIQEAHVDALRAAADSWERAFLNSGERLNEALVRLEKSGKNAELHRRLEARIRSMDPAWSKQVCVELHSRLWDLIKGCLVR